MPAPMITPLPPVVRGLPRVGSGLELLWNPTAYFARARKRHGDTFVTDAFGFRLFCVFSPEGVQSLYSLEEKNASFGLATYRLIKFKMPEDLLIARLLEGSVPVLAYREERKYMLFRPEERIVERRQMRHVHVPIRDGRGEQYGHIHGFDFLL